MLDYFEHKTILQYIGLMLIIMSGIRILHQIASFDYYVREVTRTRRSLNQATKYFLKSFPYMITYLMFAIGIALLHFFK